MPIFRYQGIDAKGKKASGVVDAENEKAARAKLRKGNIFPTLVAMNDGRASVAEVGGRDVKWTAFFQRIKPQDMALMTRQFASLLNAGVPLVEALGALSEQIEQVPLRNALLGVRDRVTEGEKLSHAMQRYPKIFNDLYFNMVSAGEASGTLESVLERLADITEAQAKLRAKIVGALTYPAVMMGVGLVMVVLLVTFILPNMTAMLLDMNVALPFTTRALIGFTDFVLVWWWAILLVVGTIVYAVQRWVRSPGGKETIDRKVLRVSLIGKLVRLSTIASLTRTLGTLLQSGVPMLAAMDIARNIIGNTQMRAVIEQTRDAVKEGASLADPLRRSGEFPPLALHMIAIGEKTGELENMLIRVANTYEQQVEQTIGTLMGLMEPIMLVVMGGMVGFLVVSVVWPMVNAAQQL